MISDITLGQFFPGRSILHRLDPRMKLVLVIVLIAAVFTADSVISYLLVASFAFVMMILSDVPVKMYIKSLKPIWFVVVLIALLNLFTYPDDPILSFWILKISVKGILYAVKMALRIVLLMIVTSALTYTTSPVLIAGGLEGLLYPLTLLHVPVHDFSMMLTIALRFIPTLTDETEKIINAQKARGADFETGKLSKRVRAVVPIIVPLFVSCFRHADELAEAMMCRCYTGAAEGRTKYVLYKLSVADFIALAVCVLLLGAVIVLNTLLLWGGY